MNTVLIALLFLLNALLMPLVVELVKERAPGLALRMIRLAVRLLPSAHRDRYRQEWTAELDEMQRQNISQLVSSLRILLGTPSLGWVLHVRDRRQLSTQIEPGAAPLIHEFTQLQISRMSQFLKQFSEDGEVSYDGEDRDWILGLTMRCRHTIDAISLSTVHADGEGFDGGLWISDFGHRYLQLQQDATRREVVVRRVFVIDQHRQTSTGNLRRLCQLQKDLGIHVKILDKSAIPDATKSPISEFVVFDNALSYEITPTPHDMNPTVVQTRLVLQPERVTARMRQFEDLWSAAREQ